MSYRVGFAPLYETMETIKAWHRLPSEFGLCQPDENLPMMIAFERVNQKIKEIINAA